VYASTTNVVCPLVTAELNTTGFTLNEVCAPKTGVELAVNCTFPWNPFTAATVSTSPCDTPPEATITVELAGVNVKSGGVAEVTANANAPFDPAKFESPRYVACTVCVPTLSPVVASVYVAPLVPEIATADPTAPPSTVN
jgi:hypothetical protein